MGPPGRRLEAVVAELAARYDEVNVRGSEPPWLDRAVEERLDKAITEAFRALDPARAMDAIEAWRSAWLAIFTAPASGITGSAAGTASAVIEETARRLGVERLFELAHDPAILESEKAIYRAEVHRRTRAMGAGPPAKAAGDGFVQRGMGVCQGHRRWRSAHGVVICAVCHPPAHPDLVAEWFPASHAEPNGVTE